MTVSAGVGGGATVGGVLISGTAGGGGVSLVRELPFTGATHLMLLLAVGTLLVVAGILMTGLGRRHAGPSPKRPARGRRLAGPARPLYVR